MPLVDYTHEGISLLCCEYPGLPQGTAYLSPLGLCNLVPPVSQLNPESPAASLHPYGFHDIGTLLGVEFLLVLPYPLTVPLFVYAISVSLAPGACYILGYPTDGQFSLGSGLL